MRWRRWIYVLPLRLRSILHRSQLELELDEELRFHLERLIEHEIAAGRTPEEARYFALRAMNGVEQRKEECRDARRVTFFDDLVRDLRYAVRQLRRNWRFAALAIVIMAVAIGATTAVFSVVNAVILTPLPYPDSDQLVTLVNSSRTNTTTESIGRQVSIPNFQDWRAQAKSFDAMAYYASRETSVTSGAVAEYVQATQVSVDFFRVFAVDPMLGRLFTAEETTVGGTGPAIISHSYWQSHFGRNPRVLDQTIRLYGATVPIVGVLPAGFHFPNSTDVWLPTNTTTPKATQSRSANNYLAVGRLKRHIRLEQAQSELDSIAMRLEQHYPDSNRDRGVAVTRMLEEMVGDVRVTLYLLFGAVAILLFIACANTATLLLGKATTRIREIAMRAALGASRRRILRQLITESLVLALLAGAAGLALAVMGSKALVALAPADLPRLSEIRIDGWVLVFTIGMSLITSLLFGVVPALYGSSVDLNEVLKQGVTRSVVGGGPSRVRGALVVAEVALSVVLLTGAGLLIKSFVALHNVDLGFRPENVLVMRATVPVSTRDDTRRANQFFKDVLGHVSNLPGVIAAGATMAPPGDTESIISYFADRMPVRLDVNSPQAVASVVAPDTFKALGIPINAGRDFDDRDTYDAPLTAVVNEALARESFPGKDPLGQTIFCVFDSLKPMTIVGVVGNVRQHGPARDPMPECYMPYEQHQYNGSTLSVVVRTQGEPTALAQRVRRLAHDRSTEVPVKFTTMESSLSENVATPRFRTLLLGIFAALAIGLAMTGVFGVMTFTVNQRLHEIGLRMALGASTASVRWLVLGEGLALTGVGLALGLAGALAGTRLLATMLFHIEPGDPMVYAFVILILGSAAMIASYVPVRRATSINLLAAFRQD